MRRIHVSGNLKPGRIELDRSQARHVRDVLRLESGDEIEAFDDAGNVAAAKISQCDRDGVAIQIEKIQPQKSRQEIIIAAAVPKGERADWMIEKLSELGVSRFIPLQTARSVVLPTGKGKHDRWVRLATESAKQSHRPGVMQIDKLTPLNNAIDQHKDAPSFYLDANAPVSIQSKIQNPKSAILFVGPEGGWTPDEIEHFNQSHLTGVKLTETILRVETAAVAAAVVAMLSWGTIS